MPNKQVKDQDLAKSYVQYSRFFIILEDTSITIMTCRVCDGYDLKKNGHAKTRQEKAIVAL